MKMYCFIGFVRKRKDIATLLKRLLCITLIGVSISTGSILAQQKSIGDRIHSKDFDTRFDAVLELTGKKDAVGILTDVLNHDTSSSIRALAATELGKSESPDAVSPLLAALNSASNKKDVFLRRTIVYALGSFQDPSVVTDLIAILRDKEPMIRSAAVDSLDKIADRRSVTALIQSLRDNNSFVRARAAIALGSIKDSQAVTPLVSALSGDESGDVRREAARSLGKIGGAEAQSALTAALLDKDMLVRQYSAEALRAGKP